MSPYLSGILLSHAAAVLGLMSPGPNILAVIGTSMGVNRKAGISLALGVSAGALLWGLLTGAGLTALLTAYASARSADIAKPSRMSLGCPAPRARVGDAAFAHVLSATTIET
jgi:hypothetical protein